MASDIYKSIKVPLKYIIKNDIDYNLFHKCIHKSNHIYFVCSQFINAFILYSYNNKLDIPNLDYDFIRIAFKVLSKKSCGPNPKSDNLITFNLLTKFFNDEFIYCLTDDAIIENVNNYKYDSTNLSYIFNMFATEMATSYKNNITLNFFKYVHQYVNQFFIIRLAKLSKDEYDKLTPTEQIKYKQNISSDTLKIKNIKKELILVKLDLINQTKQSDVKYHEWIDKHMKIIFPKMELNITSYEDDIKVNHHKYLKHMLVMNNELEKAGYKLFSAISLRTEITDKYVHIDTSALKDIFNKVNTDLSNDELWSLLFNIKKNKLKLLNYSFNHLISTDGYTVSVIFIKNSNIEAKQRKINLMTTASSKSKQLRKNKTEEEIEKIKKDQNENKLKQKVIQINKLKEIKQKNKENFKKLDKTEQDKIKMELKLGKNKYEYIEDAIKNDILLKKLKIKLENDEIKVVDPGKRCPMTILGKKTTENINLTVPYKISTGKQRGDNILYSYSTGARLNATKRLKYNKLILNKKSKIKVGTLTLKELEQELSKYNSKTTNYMNFKLYIKAKIKLRNLVNNPLEKTNIKNLKKILKDNTDTNKISDEEFLIDAKNFINLYELVEIDRNLKIYNTYMKKLKWYAYINKRRHEDNLLNELDNIYGKNATYIMGDWSNKGKLKYISTPNIGMKKLLSKRHDVYLIDEFRTSKFHHKTVEEMRNLKINYKK